MQADWFLIKPLKEQVEETKRRSRKEKKKTNNQLLSKISG
jgi:hypothetical protein